MTYYFMREAWLISKIIWDMTMNYSGTSSLLYFLGTSNNIPGATEEYKQSMSHAITTIQIQTHLNPHVSTQMRGPTENNLQIKRAIVGWITNRIESPSELSDCYNEIQHLPTLPKK